MFSAQPVRLPTQSASSDVASIVVRTLFHFPKSARQPGAVALDALLMTKQALEPLGGYVLGLVQVAVQVANQDRFHGPIVPSEEHDST